MYGDSSPQLLLDLEIKIELTQHSFGYLFWQLYVWATGQDRAIRAQAQAQATAQVGGGLTFICPGFCHDYCTRTVPGTVPVFVLEVGPRQRRVRPFLTEVYS